MLTFTVAKPLDVPLEKGEINYKKLTEFWSVSGGLGEEIGCYIFAVPRKWGVAGMMPIYVGKSDGPFSGECFTTDKLFKLGEYLRHHPADRLTLFLIVHPPSRGRANGTAIQELEIHLIRLAYIAHPNLINKQHAHDDGWTVRGLLSDGKGKRSRDAIELRAILGIDEIDEPASAPPASETVISNGTPASIVKASVLAMLLMFACRLAVADETNTTPKATAATTDSKSAERIAAQKLAYLKTRYIRKFRDQLLDMTPVYQLIVQREKVVDQSNSMYLNNHEAWFSDEQFKARTHQFDAIDDQLKAYVGVYFWGKVFFVSGNTLVVDNGNKNGDGGQIYIDNYPNSEHLLDGETIYSPALHIDNRSGKRVYDCGTIPTDDDLLKLPIVKMPVNNSR